MGDPSKLAQLIGPDKLEQMIAKEEGFGVVGALPTRQNNPGDLRHSPGEVHPSDAPNSIGSFATPEEGWQALDRQLNLFAARGMTLRQVIYTYAPPSENDSQRYLDDICGELNCSADISAAEALTLT